MPTSYYSLQYGSYVYQTTIDKPASWQETMVARLRTAETPNVDGEYAACGLLGAREIKIEGSIRAITPAALEAAWLNFRAMHGPSSPQPLYLNTDKFLNAQVKAVSETQVLKKPGITRYYSVTFRCSDPYWYGIVSNLVTLAAGNTAVTTNGTAQCLPVIVLTVTAAGLITFSNQAGQSCSIAPTATDTYTINSQTQKVTNSAGANVTNLFTGTFLKLAAGANTITLATSGGATLSGSTIGWTDRWL